MSVHYLPEDCNTLNLYLFVEDGQAAVDFYQTAFDGILTTQMKGPDGSIMHAAVRIGNSSLMLSQASPQWGTKSAKAFGGSPVSVHLYVEDADKAFQKAISAGCIEVGPMMDCFWGERMGKVEDPFGFQWGISTRTEDLTTEEVERRAAEWMKQMSEG